MFSWTNVRCVRYKFKKSHSLSSHLENYHRYTCRAYAYNNKVLPNISYDIAYPKHAYMHI